MRKVNWIAIVTWCIILATSIGTLYLIIFMLRAVL